MVHNYRCISCGSINFANTERHIGSWLKEHLSSCLNLKEENQPRIFIRNHLLGSNRPITVDAFSLNSYQRQSQLLWMTEAVAIRRLNLNVCFRRIWVCVLHFRRYRTHQHSHVHSHLRMSDLQFCILNFVRPTCTRLNNSGTVPHHDYWQGTCSLSYLHKTHLVIKWTILDTKYHPALSY